MAESTKNLCAQIPASLHSTVRERQEASGQSLSQYMTWLITTFYETEMKNTVKENVRTVAFQVPEEQDIKHLLSVYYQQDVTTEHFESFDGEGAVSAYG